MPIQSNTDLLRNRAPRRPLRAAALILLTSLAGTAAQAQPTCPGGSGEPIQIHNLKDKERLAYDLVLIKGTAPAGAAFVTLTAGGESRNWPVGDRAFKGMVRLKPGANPVVVSAVGTANTCLELTYAPEAHSKQIRLVLALPRDHQPGDALFQAHPGEPATLESARKRIALAALLSQGLYGDLMHKAGRERVVPHYRRDAQGEPEVLTIHGDFSKADTALSYETKYASVEPKLAPYQDGRTRFMVFFSRLPSLYLRVAGANLLCGMEEGMPFWPQSLDEIVPRFNDRRAMGELRFPGKLDIANPAEQFLKASYGFWFRVAARYTLHVQIADTLAKTPMTGAADSVHSLFLSRTSSGQLIPGEVALDTGTAEGLLSNPWFTRPPGAGLAAAPAASAAQGLRYSYYEGPFALSTDFAVFAPQSHGISAGFDLDARKAPRNYAFVFDGYLKAPMAGSYLFQSEAKGAVILTVGGKRVLTEENWMDKEADGVALAAGYHRLKVVFLGDTVPPALKLSWAHAGGELQRVPSTALFHDAAPSKVRALGAPHGFTAHRTAREVALDLAMAGSVSLHVVTPQGRTIGSWHAGPLEAGRHRLPAPAGSDAAMILLEALGTEGRLRIALPPAGR